MTPPREVYILDTRAFVVGALPPEVRELYITDGVLEEASRVARTMNRAVAHMEEGRVRSVAVDEEALRLVRKRATEIGELGKLSKADLEIAAAAVAFSGSGKKATVLTDDYALQNLLSSMNVSYRPVTHKGIAREVVYLHRCSACGKLYGRPLKKCPDCGSNVVRVRSTTRRVTRSQDP